jgi:hypothetical protein
MIWEVQTESEMVCVFIAWTVRVISIPAIAYEAGPENFVVNL